MLNDEIVNIETVNYKTDFTEGVDNDVERILFADEIYDVKDNEEAMARRESKSSSTSILKSFVAATLLSAVTLVSAATAVPKFTVDMMDFYVGDSSVSASFTVADYDDETPFYAVVEQNGEFLSEMLCEQSYEQLTDSAEDILHLFFFYFDGLTEETEYTLKIVGRTDSGDEVQYQRSFTTALHIEIISYTQTYYDSCVYVEFSVQNYDGETPLYAVLTGNNKTVRKTCIEGATAGDGTVFTVSFENLVTETYYSVSVSTITDDTESSHWYSTVFYREGYTLAESPAYDYSEGDLTVAFALNGYGNETVLVRVSGENGYYSEQTASLSADTSQLTAVFENVTGVTEVTVEIVTSDYNGDFIHYREVYTIPTEPI